MKMQKPTIAALMPMRANSERVKDKNIRDFAGKPLYHYMLESLLACESIDEVVINTDSDVIKEQCARLFPAARLIDRPDHLRAGTVPMTDVILYDIDRVNADFYVQTHSTNPLLKADTVNAAIKAFLDGYPVYDSLFTVTRLQTRLWDQLARPVNHNASILLRTQDLPPIYEENSCIYIFNAEQIRRNHTRIGTRPIMFELERSESVDIDEMADFEYAEFLMNKRMQNGVLP